MQISMSNSFLNNSGSVNNLNNQIKFKGSDYTDIPFLDEDELYLDSELEADTFEYSDSDEEEPAAQPKKHVKHKMSLPPFILAAVMAAGMGAGYKIAKETEYFERYHEPLAIAEKHESDIPELSEQFGVSEDVILDCTYDNYDSQDSIYIPQEFDSLQGFIERQEEKQFRAYSKDNQDEFDIDKLNRLRAKHDILNEVVDNMYYQDGNVVFRLNKSANTYQIAALLDVDERSLEDIASSRDEYGNYILNPNVAYEIGLMRFPKTLNEVDLSDNCFNILANITDSNISELNEAQVVDDVADDDFRYDENRYLINDNDEGVSEITVLEDGLTAKKIEDDLAIDHEVLYGNNANLWWVGNTDDAIFDKGVTFVVPTEDIGVLQD